MLDQWFSVIRLSMSVRRFHQLPRHPAYKYEYLGGQAWLSPRPKYYGARLALRSTDEVPPREIEADRGRVRFRPVDDRDWPRLTRPFALAFHRVQPFEGLGARRRLEAARDCLRDTRGGLDGPIIPVASFVAHDAESGRPIGANLVTLVPPIDPDDFWASRWESPPPPDGIERRAGAAHLTWIFVGDRFAGLGIGTALLAHAVEGLAGLGYTELFSSFLLGNDSSMLWHWRNGFELLPFCGSRRRFAELMRRLEAGGEPRPAEAESPP